MKKLLKVTALSVTACALLGTSMVSAEETETSGSTTVTYEPGTVSPADATWAVSMPVNVTLDESNIADGDNDSAKAISLQSVGETLTFTVFDKVSGVGTSTGGQTIEVTLTNDDDDDGKISMTATSGDAPTIALVDASSGTASYISGTTQGNAGKLINTSSSNTLTLKAGIVEGSDQVQKGDKSSVQLTFKFTKTS